MDKIIDGTLNELLHEAAKQINLSPYCDITKEKPIIKNIKIEPIEPTINLGIGNIPRGNEIFDDEYLHFLLEDIVKEKTKELNKKIKAAKEKEKKNKVNNFIFKIKKVEFNNPWTIVFWRGGDVTRVRCQAGEPYDAEKGLAMAIIKHFFEDTSYYNEIFKNFLNKDDDKDVVHEPVKKKKFARRQKKNNDGHFEW